MAAPRTMVTGTAAREDSTSSHNFVDLVPTPGLVFRTSREATITALFVTECKVSRAGQRLEVRITVDGEVADPGSAVLTDRASYATHSHLAFLTEVPAGRHTVMVQWRVSRDSGFVRNRSFTVWEVR